MTGMFVIVALMAAASADTFAYAYPAQARGIPALKARLDAEAARLRAQFRRDAAADARTLQAADVPHLPWELSKRWEVVTSTSAFLSLSAMTRSFSGGAHGGVSFDALLWDRRERRAIVPLTIFTGRAAFNAALRQTFCAALDRAREERRGKPVGSGSGFNDCIDPTAQTIILGSSDRRRFDQIGVLMGPYAAGSYAEGPYEVTLRVTPAVMAAVKPAYRSAFAVR